MRILITGATGFIGSSLIDRLLEDKHKLFALVRKSSRTESLKKKNIELLYGDITDRDSLNKIFGYKFDAVFHCAAYVDDKNWQKLYQCNVVGTQNICQFCLESKVNRLIYLSSVAVVSGNSQIPLTEELPFSATNLYGQSKLLAEKEVIEYRKKGLNIAIIRPAMIYGENEPHMMEYIFRFLKLGLLPVIDGGEYKFHLGYVRNVVSVLAMALTNDKLLEGSYFAADEEVLTTKEVFTILADSIGGKQPVNISKKLTAFLIRLPIVGKKIKFFLKDRVYDISRLKNAGWNPPFHARQALLATGQSWLEKQKIKQVNN